MHLLFGLLVLEFTVIEELLMLNNNLLLPNLELSVQNSELVIK